MNYQTFITIVEKGKRVRLSDAVKIIEELYNEANEVEDAIDEYNKIYTLIEMLKQQSLFIGEAADYHNAAVVCARQEDYDMACDFLDIGLSKTPYDIDLLADYLNYGTRCDRIKECDDCYQRLLLKKSEWNWRAYSFTIDYLLKVGDIKLDNNDETIYSLITEYRERIPENEDAYMQLADFLSKKQKWVADNIESSDTFESVLTYATSNESPVNKTPKCDLKLADYYYKQGKHLDKAINLLERCKGDSIDTQRSVNRNYVYLLLALCKMSQYYSSCQNVELEDKQKFAKEIYQNYHIAYANGTDMGVRNCKSLIEAFIRETQIPYPHDDCIENDL